MEKQVHPGLSRPKEKEQNKSASAQGNQTYEISFQPSFAFLQQFVFEAATAKIHLNIPESANQTRQQWANQWNILGTYLYSEASLSDIGNTYHLTRERVRQIVKQSVRKLYQESPAELKQKFPITVFEYKKPSTEISNLRRSESANGIMKPVVEMKRQGMDSTQISEEIGVDSSKLSRIRSRVKKYGVELEYFSPHHSKEYKERQATLVDRNTPTEVKQAILNDIRQVKGMKSHPYFLKLAPLLREANISVIGSGNKLDKVVQVLQKHNIAISVKEYQNKQQTMRYGIVAVADREVILEILKTDPTIAKYKRKKRTSQSS